MKYTVRKGLESPCKIRGFLSSDYWILVGTLSSAAILFTLGLRSGIISGNWNLSMITLATAIIVIPLLVRRFRRNARSRKFDETRHEHTISNFELSRIIRKK